MSYGPYDMGNLKRFVEPDVEEDLDRVPSWQY